ncbi:hypothetical protein KFE25_013563 [Diacronema lutheri]|uniref:C2H2-type domain-containing protein n=1 Tax=Diacronema lutheri TaxID=2081491 RepID=A0A8J5XV41_DIALT|nr:hypothetical protein KFE25_013563 [Diacronema lutheri]
MSKCVDPARPVVYCLRCGKPYASNDGVRKHAKRSHPIWIAEMDARNEFVFSTNPPTSIDATAAARPKFLLPAPVLHQAPAGMPLEYAALGGQMRADSAYCYALAPGGYSTDVAQAIPAPHGASACLAAHHAYQRTTQGHRAGSECAPCYASGVAVHSTIGVPVGDRTQLPQDVQIGWPQPNNGAVPASAAAVGPGAWQPAMLAHAAHVEAVARGVPSGAVPLSSVHDGALQAQGAVGTAMHAAGPQHQSLQQPQPPAVACVGGQWVSIGPAHQPQLPIARQVAALAAAKAHAGAAAALAASAARSAAEAGAAHMAPSLDFLTGMPGEQPGVHAHQPQASSNAAAALGFGAAPNAASACAGSSPRPQLPSGDDASAEQRAPQPTRPAPPVQGELPCAATAEHEHERERNASARPPDRGPPAQSRLPSAPTVAHGRGDGGNAVDEGGDSGDIPASMSVQSDGLSAYAALETPWFGAEVAHGVTAVPYGTSPAAVRDDARSESGSGSGSQSGTGTGTHSLADADNQADGKQVGNGRRRTGETSGTRESATDADEGDRAQTSDDEAIADIALTLSEEQFFSSAITTFAQDLDANTMR